MSALDEKTLVQNDTEDEAVQPSRPGPTEDTHLGVNNINRVSHGTNDSTSIIKMESYPNTKPQNVDSPESKYSITLEPLQVEKSRSKGSTSSRRLKSRLSMAEKVEHSYIGWSHEAPLTELLLCCFWEKESTIKTRKRGNTMTLDDHKKEEEADKEQKWFGLFTDLIFVTVIIQFARQINYHYKGFFLLPTTLSDHYYPTKEYSMDHNDLCEERFLESNGGILVSSDGMECYHIIGGLQGWVWETALFYFAFYVIWLELSAGLGRFINITGIVDDFLYFMLVIFIIGMTIQIAPFKMMMDERDGFSTWLSGALMTLTLIHMLYYYCIPVCRNYAWRRIWTYSLAVVINSVGFLCGPQINFVTILVSCLIVFYVSLTGFIAQEQTDLTIEHFVERFGLLIMITSGEAILALLIGDIESEDSFTQSTKQNSTIALSFTLMYILKDLYFNTDAPFKLHALTKSDMPGACVWIFLHLPICWCILFIGVSFKLIFSESPEDVHNPRYMLVFPLAIALLLIDFLPITHRHYKLSIPCVITKLVLVGCIPIGLLVVKDTLGILVWCVGVTFLHLMRDNFHKDKYEVNHDTVNEVMHLFDHDHHEKTKAENWNEWRSTGFMGPKIEIWPPYLLADFFKSQGNGLQRVKEIGSVKDYHPNEHFREEENTRDWLMEFGDLILVGVIYKFADQMKFTLKNSDQFSSYTVLGECFLFFLAFFCLWLELVVEFVRFKNMPGPFDDLMRFIFLFGIALMATQCEQRQYLSANIKGFMFWFAVSLSSIFGLHVAYLYNGIYDAIRYCRWRVMIYGMVIGSTGSCLVISIYVTEYYLNIGMLSLNVFIILFYSLNSFRVTESSEVREERRREAESEAENMHKELDELIEAHFLERFGLFVMITAGESILALVVSYAEYDQTPVTYMLIYVAFTMVFVIKMSYFSNNVNLEDGHALHKSKAPGAVAFCALHFFLCLFLLWLGTAWKLVFYKWNGKGNVERIYRLYMGAAVLGTMVCLYVCRFTHSKFVYGTLSWLRLIPIFGVMIICHYFPEPRAFSVGCVGCFLVLYYVDYKFYNRGYEEIEEVEELESKHDI